MEGQTRQFLYRLEKGVPSTLAVRLLLRVRTFRHGSDRNPAIRDLAQKGRTFIASSARVGLHAASNDSPFLPTASGASLTGRGVVRAVVDRSSPGVSVSTSHCTYDLDRVDCGALPRRHDFPRTRTRWRRVISRYTLSVIRTERERARARACSLDGR